MSQFSIFDTPIAGLKVIERKPNSDHRGFLARIFCADQLKSAGWERPIAQINQTVTKKRGTVRGMHFQNTPHAEMKLVSCLQGEIWDVAVDLRKNSPTFLKWHAEKLSSDNFRALLIPEGFAHGFQTLLDDCELIYLHSAPYVRGSEAGIGPNDPYLDISWPLDFFEISTRDAEHPLLNDQFTGIEL
ncbi:dTDP-4-keto-6-deoxy-D-glucose epimerase [Polynucleobacter paneuropaeus]|jgi:dTDP-4-dehydrorhamnose 3,5-epimerase|nr:dTDP-4-keto-6-deoxy-D-glucose epimerase [Polynucleobacter paneuropaeus]